MYKLRKQIQLPQTAAVEDSGTPSREIENDIDALAGRPPRRLPYLIKTVVADARYAQFIDKNQCATQLTYWGTMHAERDTAAQAALAKETSKTKCRKSGIEADIADLMKRLQTLTMERADFEKRKHRLEAEIAALAKRKMEAAKEVTP